VCEIHARCGFDGGMFGARRRVAHRSAAPLSRLSCIMSRVSSSCEGGSCDDRGDHACVWVCGAPAVASRDASRLKAKPAPMCAHYVVWADDRQKY
jgi:hypothetical protein